MLKAVLGREEN